VRRRCQSRCVLRRLTRLGGSHRHRPRASLCAASDAPLRFLADQDAFSKIREREAARAVKQWQTADAIRDELAAQGIQLMDTADGTDWYSR